MITFFVYIFSMVFAFFVGRWSVTKTRDQRVRHITTSESWNPTDEELEMISELFEDLSED